MAVFTQTRSYIGHGFVTDDSMDAVQNGGHREALSLGPSGRPKNLETVTLTDVGGLSQLCGVDQNAKLWCEFWADVEPPDAGGVRCTFCGTEISNGWICLESGEFLCHAHVAY